MLKFNREDRHRYDDIIDLPHHVSKSRPRMPVSDRAAQFAPFSALTGHEAAVQETSRLTREKIELDESCKAVFDRTLNHIRELLASGMHPAVSVIYFVPDARKAGGSYEEAVGCVRGIDGYKRMIFLEEGIVIPIDEIAELKELDKFCGFDAGC